MRTETYGAPGASRPDLSSAFVELQNLLISTSDIDEFLGEVASLAATAISPFASCGITLRRNGRDLTVASSGELANVVDELQYGRGVGPCLQAMHTSKIVIVPDLTLEDRWGDYPLHALTNGVAGSLSIPLGSPDVAFGALNLYTTETHECTSDEIAQASAFAAQASGALTISLRRAEAVTLEGQLKEALASRAVIDQALGVIMGQRRCTVSEAFAVLRAASQHRNAKLQIVAGEVVEMVTGHPAEATRPFIQR